MTVGQVLERVPGPFTYRAFTAVVAMLEKPFMRDSLPESWFSDCMSRDANELRTIAAEKHRIGGKKTWEAILRTLNELCGGTEQRIGDETV